MSVTKGKTYKKKANNPKEKWVKEQTVQKKGIQVTQMYEKMFSITHNNRNENENIPYQNL